MPRKTQLRMVLEILLMYELLRIADHLDVSRARTHGELVERRDSDVLVSRNQQLAQAPMSKNPRSGLPGTPTTSPRSRNRLNCSQAVSGTSAQA